MMDRAKNLFCRGLLTLMLSTICLVALSLGAGEAKAQGPVWNFSEQCSESVTIPIDEPDPINYYVQLDKSSSMGTTQSFFDWATGDLLEDFFGAIWDLISGIFGGGWPWAETGIGVAQAALLDFMETADYARVGMGFVPCSNWVYDEGGFLGFGSGWECSSNSGSTEVMVAGPNTADDVNDLFDDLDDDGAGGNTDYLAAFQGIANSQSMNDPNHEGVAVFITDGRPNFFGFWDDPADPRSEACAMRGQYPTFVASVGENSNDSKINKMAAAAGTGYCDDGDPCVDDDVDADSCHGGVYVQNISEMNSVLYQALNRLDCSFRVERESGGIPEDPRQMRVEIESASSGWIYHDDQMDDDDGWTYTTDGEAALVTLPSEYCQGLAEGDIQTVSVEFGCDCTEPTGDVCVNEGVPEGVCAVGEWACNMGEDICEPYEPDVCPASCQDDDWEGALCHRGEHEDITLQDFSSPDELKDALDGEVDRCEFGEIRCTLNEDGTEDIACEEAYRPMPEVCDGMDNSCSGEVDDIDQSWSDFYAGEGAFAGSQWDDASDLESLWQGPTCNETQSLCVCDTPRTDPAGSPGGSVVEEFQSYLEGWSADYCSCSPAVSP